MALIIPPNHGVKIEDHRRGFSGGGAEIQIKHSILSQFYSCGIPRRLQPHLYMYTSCFITTDVSSFVGKKKYPLYTKTSFGIKMSINGEF